MIQTKEIEYQAGQVISRGFLAYDDQNNHPTPCVMVAPDWSGRNKMACDKAKQLARLGYVGFALDMYGQAALGESKEQKRALLDSIINDRNEVAIRMLAALNTVTHLTYVDKNQIAAIGYCFGGLCVLDLARTGAEIKGVVSFHGVLSPSLISDKKISAKILVLHGYDDPLVPSQQVYQFATEMTEKKVDWQIHMYGLTQHSFTNPEANDNEMGLHYNEAADRRSWKSTESFLTEIFKY